MPQSRRELAYLHNSRGAALTIMAQVQAERCRLVGVCRHVARLPRPHPVVQHQRAKRQRLGRRKVHPRGGILHHVPAFQNTAAQQLHMLTVRTARSVVRHQLKRCSKTGCRSEHVTGMLLCWDADLRLAHSLTMDGWGAKSLGRSDAQRPTCSSEPLKVVQRDGTGTTIYAHA